MSTFHSHCSAVLLAGFLTAGLVGCGGSDSDNTVNRDQQTTHLMANTPLVPHRQSMAPPTDVVSQFLDLVRRGGQTEQATRLLTTKAQSELKRIGRSVQPIGSPDAQFKITRFELVPLDPEFGNSDNRASSAKEQDALVHCLWTEPSEQGNTEATQVVWAVQEESGSWRISGLAIEIEAGKEPMLINFEDGNRMAAILADVESEDHTVASPTGSSSTQAAAKDDSLSR